MGVHKELGKIGEGLGGFGAGFTQMGADVRAPFDPAQKEARATLKAAQAEAAKTIATAQGEVAAAQAKAAANAVKAQAEATVEAIKSGKGVAAKPSFLSRVAAVGGQIGGGVKQAIGDTLMLPVRLTGKILGAPLKLSAKAGVGAVDMAAGLALKPVKWTAGGIGNVFARSPWTSSAVVVGAAALGAGSWLAKRNSENLQAQGEAIAQMQAVQQPSYMNSVSPDESAMLAAMQKQNGQVGGSSKAEALMAAREKMPAPENAAAL